MQKQKTPILIGKFAEVEYGQLRFCGKVIDETRNTITIETNGKTKQLIKDQTKITINGQKIKNTQGRIETRIKNQ